MQYNEPFSPNLKGTDISSELNFVKADLEHLRNYVDLTLIRNPRLNEDELLKKAEREISEFNNGIDYGLFFALKNDQVVGSCRFFTSGETPKEKVRFDHPEGMYCMGIIVHPEFRRKGVATFLSKMRIRKFREFGIKEVFSVVAADNPTSIKMHESFGFKEIQRGPGFFTVQFDCGDGVLFKKILE